MKIPLLLALLSLVLATPAYANQVYKWVDAQGNVHYSDKPHPGAKEVKIAPPQSFGVPARSKAKSPEPPAKAQPATPSDYNIAISSPKPQQSLWNVHDLTVSANVSPGLREGDTVTFRLDGETKGPVNATSVTFKNVTRGEHTVSATLTTAKGARFSAKPVMFYVHQTSIRHPKPPL